MSDSLKPPLHGRDHLPEGCDPIPSLAIPWGLVKAGNVPIASGAARTSINFTENGTDGSGVITVGDVGGVTGLILNERGVYIVSFNVFAQTTGTPADGSTIEIACDFDTGDITAGTYLGAPLTVSNGPAKNLQAGTSQVVNLDPAFSYPVPNTGKVTVRQNTGLTLSCYVQAFAYRISTVTSPDVS